MSDRTPEHRHAVAELETWLPVLGHEGWYEVSSIGRVRSEDREILRRNGYPLTIPGKIHRAYLRQSGYRFACLSIAGRRTHRPVHQLVCEAFHGPRPDGMVVRHLDGDSLNNCADNLAWGTPSENAQDAIRHGANPHATRTHCPRGHALTAPNLVAAQLRIGQRECLACGRARCRVRDAAARLGQHIDLQSLADAYYAEILKDPSKRLTRRAHLQEAS